MVVIGGGNFPVAPRPLRVTTDPSIYIQIDILILAQTNHFNAGTYTRYVYTRTSLHASTQELLNIPIKKYRHYLKTTLEVL